MKPLAWMIGFSVASWALVEVATSGRAGAEVAFGMAGPLASAAVSWVAYERAHRAAPERLTNVMIAALAVKMLFFGGYVVVMIRVIEVQPVPFVASFASYFIALHAMEALFLRRLMTNDPRSPGERT